LQRNGFSPVWTRACLASKLGLAKTFEQCSHFRLSLPDWDFRSLTSLLNWCWDSVDGWIAVLLIIALLLITYWLILFTSRLRPLPPLVLTPLLSLWDSCTVCSKPRLRSFSRLNVGVDWCGFVFESIVLNSSFVNSTVLTSCAAPVKVVPPPFCMYKMLPFWLVLPKASDESCIEFIGGMKIVTFCRKLSSSVSNCSGFSTKRSNSSESEVAHDDGWTPRAGSFEGDI